MRKRTLDIINKVVETPSSTSLLERYELKYYCIVEKNDCFDDENFKRVLFGINDELVGVLSQPIILINEKIENNTFSQEEKLKILNALRI